MQKIKSWLKAFRLRTLPLSLSGIIAGTFLAYEKGYWDTLIFVLGLTTTLFFQIISNLANDLGDTIKGTDNEDRVGPKRTMQLGLISSKEMKVAIVLFMILSIISASFLIYLGTKDLPLKVTIIYFILLVLSIVSAITYTIGKKAYGYSGFGDLFVFIFFGLVSVFGMNIFLTKEFNMQILPMAIAIGFLSVAVLNLNNMRDFKNDLNFNKNTLVVKIGINNAKTYHSFLIVLSFIMLILQVYFLKNLTLLFCLLPFFILFQHLNRVLKNKEERLLDNELKIVALSTFAICIIFTITSILSK